MKSGTFWPLFLAAILLAGVGGNVALLIVANADPSFAVEKDYYAKALRWDETQREARASRDLGWRLRLAARRSERGPGWTELEVRLADRDGSAVSGASVAVEAFHHARAADLVAGELAPRGAGAYATTIPTPRRGLWELRVRARRGADLYTRVLQEELGGGP